MRRLGLLAMALGMGITFSFGQAESGFVVEVGYGGSNVYKGDFMVSDITANFEMQSAYYLQVGYAYRPRPQWVLSAGLAGYQDNFRGVYRHIIGYPNRGQVDEEQVTYLAVPLTLGYTLVEERVTLYTGWQPEWKVAQTGVWLDPDQSWNPSLLMGVQAHLWSGLSLNVRGQVGTTNLVNPASIEYWDPIVVERTYLYTYRGHVGVSWSF